MSQHDRSIKKTEKAPRTPGSLDRGPVEFKSHIASHEGEIMAIATRNVISVPPTMRILSAVETMTKCGFRRLPVIDPGSRKLRGIVTSGDIINFLGGGDKYNLVKVKHGGNLLAAVNESIRTIMTTQLTTLPESAGIADALEIIMTRMIGGLPIIGEGDRVTGIVTERDVMKTLAGENLDETAEDIMSTALRVTSPDATIGEVTRDMTKHRFRRLPVVSDDVLFGIITTSDILRYFGDRKIFSRMETGNVKELMTMPVRNLVSGDLFTTTPDRNINDVAREMVERSVGALPVIENARLIGLVTEFDLVKAFAKES
jgi:CBS domain-containing protein